MKISCQQWLSSAAVISLASGFHSALNEEIFHSALNEEILHGVNKTPGLDHPALEELTRAFLLAAGRGDTLVQSSAQRSRDSTGMSRAQWNASRRVFPAGSSDSSCPHVGYRLGAEMLSQQLFWAAESRTRGKCKSSGQGTSGSWVWRAALAHLQGRLVGWLEQFPWQPCRMNSWLCQWCEGAACVSAAPVCAHLRAAMCCCFLIFSWKGKQGSLASHGPRMLHLLWARPEMSWVLPMIVRWHLLWPLPKDYNVLSKETEHSCLLWSNCPSWDSHLPDRGIGWFH